MKDQEPTCCVKLLYLRRPYCCKSLFLNEQVLFSSRVFLALISAINTLLDWLYVIHTFCFRKNKHLSIISKLIVIILCEIVLQQRPYWCLSHSLNVTSFLIGWHSADKSDIVKSNLHNWYRTLHSNINSVVVGYVADYLSWRTSFESSVQILTANAFNMTKLYDSLTFMNT